MCLIKVKASIWSHNLPQKAPGYQAGPLWFVKKVNLKNNDSTPTAYDTYIIIYCKLYTCRRYKNIRVDLTFTRKILVYCHTLPSLQQQAWGLVGMWGFGSGTWNASQTHIFCRIRVENLSEISLKMFHYILSVTGITVTGSLRSLRSLRQLNYNLFAHLHNAKGKQSV